MSHLVSTNKVLAELESLVPKAVFLIPPDLTDLCYLVFPNARQGSTFYGQTGYSSGVYLPAGKMRVFHALAWASSKQTRVAFSSTGAEILAAAASTNRESPMA